MRLKKFTIIIGLMLLQSMLFAQASMDSVFLQGPNKEWTRGMYDAYYRWAEFNFAKPSGNVLRQTAIMNGNKITTEIFNFGSISSPGNTITDIVWEKLGYGYEFAPFVGAEVPVPQGSNQDVMTRIVDYDTTYFTYIISDGLQSNGGEVSPDNLVRWGWQPLAASDDGQVEYMDQSQTRIPTSDDLDRDSDGKPDSWPAGWYNPALRNYVWPGALGQGATNADQEAFFVMDDRDNFEFMYYPYTKLGYESRTAVVTVGPDTGDGFLLMEDVTANFNEDEINIGVTTTSDVVVIRDTLIALDGSEKQVDRFYHIESIESPTVLKLKKLANNRRSTENSLGTVEYTIKDAARKGLGLEVEARYYQWSNVQAEDAIFLIYKITNKSEHDLNKVVFGMWGDPHIGGPADWRDDWASFDRDLEITFAWDSDGQSLNDPTRIPGYLGYKFLESPGIATDGIDNDEDGMIDESWTDGIDNDNDWSIDNDDVGVDGVPNTGDFGEGDGIPTAGDPFDIRKPGEPNFEFTDIDESDMLGLTSFAQPLFSGLRISNDRLMYTENLTPGKFDTTAVEGDYVFLYGSGRFTLKSLLTAEDSEVSEAIKRFSIGLLLGADRSDLVLNANTVQKIYNSGYQFAKPPAKPTVTVVPGDRKVTLYWDDVAEKTIDPSSGKVDFEGYMILRSTDPNFEDQQTITDANGTPFLFEPLKAANGSEARFDLINDYSGYSTIPFTQQGVFYYLGNNNGLRHTYVDSNNVINGQTYFYAVVSYDHGDDSLKVAPSECSKIINFDPTTNEYKFDINTARVIPRTRAAGFTSPQIKDSDINHGIVREEGFSNGIIRVDIIDEMAVEDENKFVIRFTDTTGVEYSVEDTKPITETFTSFYDNDIRVTYSNLSDTSVVVTTLDGSVTYEEGVDYQLDAESGSIMVFDPAIHPGARMADAEKYSVRYTRFPIFRSVAVDSQMTNAIFDGMRLVVQQTPFSLDKKLTGWSSSSNTNLEMGELINRKKDPTDYEIRFSSQIVDTGAVTNVKTNFQIWDVIANEQMDFVITEKPPANGVFNPGDRIFLMRGAISPSNTTWELQFAYPDTTDTEYVPPTDGDVYYIATNKPFSGGDVFSFTSLAAQIDKSKAKNQLDQIRVVPNPYVATNVIEEKNFLDRTSRGFRRIYFDKLPAVCTIRIYTMAGELVRVLEHNSTADDGQEFWNLLTKDNVEVAYGLYFFHVDAPGIGEKVGKFAIIK
jgi:hypothetical protein